MIRMLAFGGLFLSLMLLDTGPVLGQKKKDKATPASAADYKQLAKLQYVVGELAYADASSPLISLRLEFKRVEPNPDFKKGKGNSKLFGKGGPLKIVTDKKDFELETVDKVVVRRQELPVVFDEKGNVKKRSQTEIAKLRGNSNYPGYAAKWDDLQVGQSVKLTLSPPKKQTDGAVAKPRVWLILILDAADPPAKDALKKKDKK